MVKMRREMGLVLSETLSSLGQLGRAISEDDSCGAIMAGLAESTAKRLELSAARLRHIVADYHLRRGK